MASPSASPGDEAARVCLDILRGASQLAQPYAAHLSKLLQGEGREQERALVEALGGCLLEVVAAAQVERMRQQGESVKVRAWDVMLLVVHGGVAAHAHMHFWHSVTKDGWTFELPPRQCSTSLVNDPSDDPSSCMLLLLPCLYPAIGASSGPSGRARGEPHGDRRRR
jgi:hypothetical protein